MGEGTVRELPISSFELYENKLLDLTISRTQRVIVEFLCCLTEHRQLRPKSLTGNFVVEDTNNF